ncbi:DnaD domain-containing protein [Exiguobacterium aestuarii]|uniref:DnaD domain-containing protein n=1 Tax=Exiguobacterium aestuarii TaxID=273527 RepID=UPI001CD672FA|nr:DnaD domain protein [Exiguobacterium aestuarii]MCA0980211.1 DnaD domain protein [Exiguobacterium aestuarii]
MGVYRPVQTEFWTDPKVVEEFTPEDRLFYLYLLTNPSTTQIGIYQITKKTMAFELGYSIESINALMDRFIRHHKLIDYNPETREVVILNWGKHNFKRAGKPIVDLVTKELRNVKHRPYIQLVAPHVPVDSIREIYESWYESSTNRGTNRGQTKEEEEKKEETKEETKEEEKGANDESSPSPRNELADLVSFFQNEGFGNATTFIIDEMRYELEDSSYDVVRYALEQSVTNGVRNWNYAKKIIKDKREKNLLTREAIEAFEAKRSQPKRGYDQQETAMKDAPAWLEEEANKQREHDKRRQDELAASVPDDEEMAKMFAELRGGS